MWEKGRDKTCFLEASMIFRNKVLVNRTWVESKMTIPKGIFSIKASELKIPDVFIVILS